MTIHTYIHTCWSYIYIPGIYIYIYIYLVRKNVHVYKCMYGRHIEQSVDQPEKVVNPAHGQLNGEI